MKLLEGVKVVESAAVITGPFAAMLLADLGADVIKLEPPAGDQFRRWESDAEGVLPTFATYNRGKRSIAVNLKEERGREVYRNLVAGADAVVENFRPGAMEKLGLGYESLKELNPGLVYCHITGMGTVGPDKDRPTFDAVAQALSGLWSQFTDLDDPEPVGPPMADQLTGIFSALAVVAGLQKRATTGEGMKLEMNMLASCLAFQGPAISMFNYEGEMTLKTSRARHSQSYAFVAGDGKPFAVHLSTPKKFWAGMCAVAGRPELADDARYDTKPKRIEAYDEIRATFNEIFSTQPRDHWLDLLIEADVPCAPILDVSEALSYPQIQAAEIIEDMSAGNGLGGLVKSPVRVNGKHLAGERPAPMLAADTDEILGEIGLSAGDIAELKDQGIVGG